MYGIYIHVPFCVRKCPYCDFYSVAVQDELRRNYIAALKNQILSFPPIEADTIYFGGGTPSLLSPSEISDILSCISGHHSVEDACEITMECNPASADLNKMKGFREAGVNRLSVGCQSFQQEILDHLGRLHTAEEAADTVREAREAGFGNISVDIMLGVPFSSPESSVKDAEKAASLGVDHVSAYLLKICEGTPFAAGVKGIPDDDIQADCYTAFCGSIVSSGYSQYEISNFAKPGMESRHNMKYWQCGQWLGFGPSAHMSDGRKRYSSGRDLRSYLETYSSPVSDPLSFMAFEGSVDAEEYIMTSLRTSEGLDTGVLEKVFGGSLESSMPFLRKCAEGGLVKISGNRISLTRDGFLVSNSILSEII